MGIPSKLSNTSDAVTYNRFLIAMLKSLAHVGHGRNLVENLISVSYDITSLVYAEMIKQEQNTTNVSSV